MIWKQAKFVDVGKPSISKIHPERASCKCFDKGVDITFVVVRGERDPNASATCTAHNIVTTKSFHNCLYAFARVAQ